MLDEALAQLSPEDRAKAEAAARKWLGTANDRLDGGTPAGHPRPVHQAALTGICGRVPPP